jgi:hypothetical protein
MLPFVRSFSLTPPSAHTRRIFWKLDTANSRKYTRFMSITGTGGIDVFAQGWAATAVLSRYSHFAPQVCSMRQFIQVISCTKFVIQKAFEKRYRKQLLELLLSPTIAIIFLLVFKRPRPNQRSFRSLPSQSHSSKGSCTRDVHISHITRSGDDREHGFVVSRISDDRERITRAFFQP